MPAHTSPPSTTPPRPAAVAVVLRSQPLSPNRLEVLLLQRNPQLPHFGGTWAFPGGAVDPGDHDHPILAPAAATAVRETHEETGLALDPHSLRACARWITPDHYPSRGRFDATYFLASPQDATQNIHLAPDEATAAQWLSAESALQAHAAGALPLTPPVYVTLTELTRFERYADALDELCTTPPCLYYPRPVAVPTGTVFLYPGDAGYAQWNPQAPGPRHRLHASQTGFRRYERESAAPT